MFVRSTVSYEEFRHGRNVSGAAHAEDPGAAPVAVAMVEQVLPGDTEIDEATYQAELAALVAANEAYHTAQPEPEEPPSRREAVRAAVEAATTLAQLKAAILELLDG